MTVRKKTSNLNLVVARTAAGLTQADIARRLRRNRVDVVRMEQGWIPPKRIRDRLAQMLRTTADALFDLRA